MTYKYTIETKANNYFESNDIINLIGNGQLTILCYHISTECKYPFLQFMLTKDNFNKLTTPKIELHSNSQDVRAMVIDKIKECLTNIECDSSVINEDAYKGVLFHEDKDEAYALVNVSELNLYGLHLKRKHKCWFVLPSEIINSKHVCNIQIEQHTCDLFTEHVSLSLLYDAQTNKPFILPDAVYSGDDIKICEINSVFGKNLTKEYEHCDPYFFFYKTFGEAVFNGGWLREGYPNRVGSRIITEPDSRKYVCGGINRYAVFVEGNTYFEESLEFSLSESLINAFFPEPCVIICYTGVHNIKPDLLVKNEDSFASLSYHKLDMNSLQDMYDIAQSKKYMIL